MCWKMPKVSTPQLTVQASSLVPQTDAPEPESPIVGGSEDTFNKRKGRQQLTIQRNGGYKSTNY